MAKRADRSGRPLYMISVAAELTGLHPQTLRIYERRELIRPQRSSGNTRLYSDEDIERLRLITHLTDEGVNLAGVVRILAMRDQIAGMKEDLVALHEAADAAERRLLSEVERVHRSYKAEIVRVRRGGLARRDPGPERGGGERR